MMQVPENPHTVNCSDARRIPVVINGGIVSIRREWKIWMEVVIPTRSLKLAQVFANMGD